MSRLARIRARATPSPRRFNLYSLPMNSDDAFVLLDSTSASVPIRRIPTEIIVLIFADFVDTNHVVSGDMPAVTLSHVCRHWRSTANCLPALWTNMTAVLSNCRNAQFIPDVVSNRLQHCLCLSRDEPLHIVIEFLGEGQKEAAAVFSLLGQHASRWRSLSTVYPPFLEQSLVELPELMEFVLPHEEFGQGFPIHFLARAPRLRVVDLGVHWSYTARYLLPIPLHQLTHFTASSPMRIFQGVQLSNLRSLRLLVDSSVDDDWDSTQELHLPALTSLAYDGLGWNLRAGLALRSIRCPSLQHLTLDNAELHPSALVDLFSMLSHPGPLAIRSLSLHVCTVWGQSFGDLLRELRCVERLTLNRVAHLSEEGDVTNITPWTREDMAALSTYELLPTLKYFEAAPRPSENWVDYWIGNDFQDFLLSRTISPKAGRIPLIRVCLHGRSPSSNADEEFPLQIKSIQEQGFDIKLLPPADEYHRGCLPDGPGI